MQKEIISTVILSSLFSR